MGLSAPPTQEHLQLIYGELKEQLRFQIEDLDALDRTSTVLLAPIGLLLGFALNAAPALLGDITTALTFSFGVGALGAALMFGILALWPRAASVAPKPSGLFPKYAGASTLDMLATECATLVEVFGINGRVRKSKNPFLYAQFVALLLGAVAIALAFGIETGA